MNLLNTWPQILAAQIAAVLLAVGLGALTWKVRRIHWLNGLLGGLSLILISAFFLALSWLKSWGGDWETPATEGFEVRFWLNAAVFESGFLLLALVISLWHRKQFGWSLWTAFFGFCLEVVLATCVPLILGTTFINRYWNQAWFPSALRDSPHFYTAFWLTYGAMWFLLTFFRPTLLQLWQNILNRKLQE